MNIQREESKIQEPGREWMGRKDLWMACQGCGKLVRTKVFLENHRVCPECDHHEKLSGYERVQSFLDKGSFVEYDKELAPGDPLNFIDSKPYIQRLKEDAAKTNLKDAIVTGEGLLQGRAIAIGAMDFAFRGGSMGAVVGEKIARCFEQATAKALPVVIFSSSGGARMQEGIFSLMQMAKTSIALSRHNQAGLLFISVLCSPTFGGVTASFSSLGDIIIAEPEALIGFAGRRVIEETIHQKLSFFTRFVTLISSKTLLKLAYGMKNCIVILEEIERGFCGFTRILIVNP
jgi:acetyl-CoA carboxylase carboxyl transferase subunit beta